MRARNILNSGLIALLFGFAAATAHAQATRTWVSGVGDDANPCSRTAPCKTFAGAISKTAPGGEIDALDPGGFGALTITKAITIDGGGGQVASVLVSGTNGFVISAGPSDVVRLRNLQIMGLGTGISGIRFLAGAALEVHNVQINQFTGQGIDFEVPSGSTATLNVTDTRIENNAGGAILVSGLGTGFAFLDGVEMIANGRGLRAEDGSFVHAKHTNAANNSASGFVAQAISARPVSMTLDHCAASHNGTGVFAGALSTVTISDMTVAGNGTGLLPSGGSILSAGNNTVLGNTTNGSATLTPGQI